MHIFRPNQGQSAPAITEKNSQNYPNVGMPVLDEDKGIPVPMVQHPQHYGEMMNYCNVTYVNVYIYHIVELKYILYDICTKLKPKQCR